MENHTASYGIAWFPERKQAEEALRDSEARFRLLSATAGRLLHAEDPQAVVEDLCRNVMAHLNCQTFFNFLRLRPAGVAMQHQQRHRGAQRMARKRIGLQRLRRIARRKAPNRAVAASAPRPNEAEIILRRFIIGVLLSAAQYNTSCQRPSASSRAR